MRTFEYEEFATITDVDKLKSIDIKVLLYNVELDLALKDALKVENNVASRIIDHDMFLADE